MAMSNYGELPRSDNTCADCTSRSVNFVVFGVAKGIFVCDQCMKAHEQLDQHMVKPIDEVLFEELNQITGNIETNKRLEAHLPIWYQRPVSDSPATLRDCFIRDKYQHQLFHKNMYIRSQTMPNESKLNGCKEGFLLKNSKDSSSFKERYFVINHQELQCYQSKSHYARQRPGEIIALCNINAFFIKKDADGKPFSKYPEVLSIYRNDSKSFRFIYLASTIRGELGDWYQSIRACRFVLLQHLNPIMPSTAITGALSLDVHFEDWLFKRGPDTNDRWLRRYVMLLGHHVIYMESRGDSCPKGDIRITQSGFNVREGADGYVPSDAFAFTLSTPDRQFVFYTTDEQRRTMWIIQLSALCFSHRDETDLIWSGRYDRRTLSVLRPLFNGYIRFTSSWYNERTIWLISALSYGN